MRSGLEQVRDRRKLDRRNFGALRRLALVALVAVAGLLAGVATMVAAPTPAAAQTLSTGDVQQIIAQAVMEARARGAKATIAVTDRVGNVLGVFQMTGAATTVTVTSGRGIALGNGLENVSGVVPSTLAAIAKAVTGAYLSSQGHAFTTRTASQIVQEFFNPGEHGQPGGPLFGVQFSQLPCSDLTISDPTLTIGPKRSPLGLSADPGGQPIYKNGILAGGIGVMADGVYGLDLTIEDFDANLDELIAIAGQYGYDAPAAIQAQRITVEGKSLRFSDVDVRNLATSPGSATFAAASAFGAVTAVTGYFGGAIVAGTTYGTAASGIRQDVAGTYPGVTAYILVDPANANRFPPIAGSVGVKRDGTASTQSLTAAEVTQIIASGLRVAYAARAQIRRPVGAYAQVTVTVTDMNANILGLARTPDAALFGTDVAVQKARSVAFFSDPRAAARLSAVAAQNVAGILPVPALSTYVTQMRSFVEPNALADGIAYGERSIGNLSRPFYPDGIAGNPNGPLSKPLAVWSPFNDGLQLDLVLNNIVTNLGTGAAAAAPFCTSMAPLPSGKTPLANGLQIFAGGVPIYKNGDLVGAIGVSGDGIDQDDMVAIKGLADAANALGSGVANAPAGIRASNLAPQGVNLRYVSCPYAPFNDSTEQTACQGL